ncbi:MAG: A24 family peptidase [Thermoguttaceae bacterium]|nr:A24 family peptidase [Thermoguttaceae bacterium]
MEVFFVIIVAWVWGWLAERWNLWFQRRIGMPESQLRLVQKRSWWTASAFTLLIVCLWWMETRSYAIYPDFGPLLLGPNGTLPVECLATTSLFLGHLILFLILWLVSLIDFDQRLIPDAPIVIGTLTGLIWAILPWGTGLPVTTPVKYVAMMHIPYQSLAVTSPELWNSAEFRGIGPLCLAVGIFWGWCFALAPRSWYPRHGWRRAAECCWQRMRRSRWTLGYLLLALIGTGVIITVWYANDRGVAANANTWCKLYSSLIGLGVGGGLIWYLRLIGKWVLRQEAMGFGDVTLTAMLGVWFGWQGVVVIFMLAPILGLIFGIVVAVLQSKPIPYGPFLSAAAVCVLFGWGTVWSTIAPTLELFTRSEIATFGGGLLLLTGPILWIVRFIRVKIFGEV